MAAQKHKHTLFNRRLFRNFFGHHLVASIQFMMQPHADIADTHTPSCTSTASTSLLRPICTAINIWQWKARNACVHWLCWPTNSHSFRAAHNYFKHLSVLLRDGGITWTPIQHTTMMVCIQYSVLYCVGTHHYEAVYLLFFYFYFFFSSFSLPCFDM